MTSNYELAARVVLTHLALWHPVPSLWREQMNAPNAPMAKEIVEEITALLIRELNRPSHTSQKEIGPEIASTEASRGSGGGRMPTLDPISTNVNLPAIEDPADD